jgi:NAD(P)-dependent dehydrogenase (short-subunit alcohol dehydrogenase family)
MTKIALVTGGGRGLGRDMALSLARKGLGVVVTYLGNRAEADKVVAEIRSAGGEAAALQLDVANTAAIGAFVGDLKARLREAWGVETLDFLVNNAGVGKTIPIERLTEDDFETFSGVHFKGVVFLTQQLLTMTNAGGGVVFITAGATRFNVPGYSIYAACKAATETFARYVAKEYGPRGVRANIVAPGGIETDFNGAAIRSNPQIQEHLKAQTALGRVGQPDDIGGVVAFLCSEDAKWVNGQRIEVTGGINL